MSIFIWYIIFLIICYWCQRIKNDEHRRRMNAISEATLAFAAVEFMVLAGDATFHTGFGTIAILGMVLFILYSLITVMLIEKFAIVNPLNEYHDGEMHFYLSLIGGSSLMLLSFLIGVIG